MKLSVRKPAYELPPYSLTGDLLSFETCPLQYRYSNVGNLPPSRPVQLWFGQYIHGVLEEAYRRYSANPTVSPPWPRAEIEEMAGRISARLRAQGLLARSRQLEAIGLERAERAVNLLGPYLLPLINRVEVKLSGARLIDRSQMPAIWQQQRNIDRYELVGVVDVVSDVELRTVTAGNPLVDAVRAAVPALPEKFEIIVDYKGMRRPATQRRLGRLELGTYEWQLQNYAYLRERQGGGLPVVAGVLMFLNELSPTQNDLSQWRTETQKGITDVPHNAAWKAPALVPDDKKLARTMHVTRVTPRSRDEALTGFDNIVKKIETCRAAESSGLSLFVAWPGNPMDKATCDACDARTFCPALSKQEGRKHSPSLPSV